MTDEPLVIVAIPPLIALLNALETRKGAPLTEEEVIGARDKAVCMSMPLSEARRLAEARGYDDLDIDDAWEAWRAFRAAHGTDG